MAKKVVALEATFNASGAEGSVKSLKAQLREAQADVQALSDKFGATSEQAVNAAKKAAGLKDAIGDAKALTDAFNPDAKFKAFGAAIQGVAGGFAALQGAQALFGSKSEELEKTLLKVQGAMALSQGLNSLGEAGDAFKTLGKQATDAFNKIKVAIGSSGIGLLVIALGAIYAYWDDIKAAVSGVSSEQEKLNAKTKANLEAQKEKLKNIGSQDNILKLQGKSERDILKLKIGQIDAVIKATEASIVQAKITKDAQVEASKRNKDILVGILEFIAAPIKLVLKGIDAIGSAVGKNFGLEDKFFGGISKLVFDPEQVAKDGDKTIKEQQTALTQLKNDRAGFQLQVQAIDKTASDTAKSNREKDDKEKEAADKEAADKEKARLDNIATQNKTTEDLIQRNRLASIKDAFTKQQNEIEGQRQKEIDAQLDLVNKKLLGEEQYEINKANINAFYNKQQQDALDAHNKTVEEKNKASKDKQTADDIKAAQDKQKAQQDINNIEIASAQELVGILGGLGEKNKGIQKAALIASGALSIAQIINNTNVGSSKEVATKGIFGLSTSAILYAKAAISIASVIAATAKGLSALGGGGGVSGGATGAGGGTTAPVQPQVATTTINQGQVNQLASATSRAFVLESDVSGNQERIERLNRAARIN